MTIRVFLVDDQEMVRAGFRMVIDSQPDLEVVGEASDGGEALQTLAVTRADVVLMDVRMPRLNGVETTRQLVERWSAAQGAAAQDGAAQDGAAQDGAAQDGAGGPPKVVVLTTFDLDEYVFAALKAGAAGFLLKDAPPADLLSAIRSVYAGDSVVAPSATKRLLERFSSYLPDDAAGQPAGDPRAELLTERERDVVLEVTRGLSNAEIAERLFLSETTVKTHMGRILAKLDLRDRVQLVVFAYESGLVRAGNA